MLPNGHVRPGMFLSRPPKQPGFAIYGVGLILHLFAIPNSFFGSIADWFLRMSGLTGIHPPSP
jgi:hypothetical protein